MARISFYQILKHDCAGSLEATFNASITIG